MFIYFKLQTDKKKFQISVEWNVEETDIGGTAGKPKIFRNPLKTKPKRKEITKLHPFTAVCDSIGE